MGRVRAIVLECGDLGPVSDFWSAVLDAEVELRQHDWVSLARPDIGPRLAFQLVDGYRPPPWPGTSGEQQVHLDIEVEELAGPRDAVLRLGAVQLSDVVDPGAGEWQVFADPAGHPFCLVT